MPSAIDDACIQPVAAPPGRKRHSCVGWLRLSGRVSLEQIFQSQVRASQILNSRVSKSVHKMPAVEGSPIRLAVLAMHPVQYHSPLYQSICSAKAFDAKVIYLDTLGLKGVYDEEFRTTVEWDIPLLDGHDSQFLKNLALNNTGGFFSRINPGLPAALKRGEFDAILIQGYSIASFWIALFAARLLGIKVIWRGEVTLKAGDTADGLRRRLRDALVRIFLKRCDAVMYTCGGNKDFLLHHGLCEEALFPFLCAVDNEYFRSEYTIYSLQAAQLRQELGIPTEDIVVLFCGRLTERKRPFDIVESIRKVGNRGLSLVIAGDGPQREDLLEFARIHEIHTVHLGFVNQSKISRYYTIADIFCLPSEYDPSPKALNEAMNFELVPIVSGTIGTSRDLVIDGDTGFRVSLGDTNAIAAHIAQLRGDHAMRRRMAARAFEHISHFSFAANVAGLEAACRAALEGSTTSSSSADAY